MKRGVLVTFFIPITDIATRVLVNLLKTDLKANPKLSTLVVQRYLGSFLVIYWRNAIVQLFCRQRCTAMKDIESADAAGVESFRGEFELTALQETLRQERPSERLQEFAAKLPGSRVAMARLRTASSTSAVLSSSSTAAAAADADEKSPV